MNETNEASRTNDDEARSPAEAQEQPSSIERLAAFTKRILRVPKAAVAESKPPNL
jgi:hypothetical protein